MSVLSKEVEKNIEVENSSKNCDIDNNVVKKNDKKVKREPKKRSKRGFIVCIFIAICIFMTYVIYRGNFLEVKEIGEKYVNSFKLDVKYRILTIAVSFIWVYVLFYTTNLRIKKGLKIFFQEENKTIPKFPNKSISFIIAAIASFVTSKIFLQKVILFFNSTSFGKTDQIYGHDIGYYLFVQPFIQSILIYMIITFALTTLYAAVYYIFLINTHFSAGVDSDTLKNSIIKRQLFNNVKFFIILVAILTCVNAENLSSQTFLNVGESENNVALVGAGTTDITIKVWGYRGLSVLMVLAVFIAVPAYYKQKNRRLIAWIASVPVYLVLLVLALIGYDKIFVNSNVYEKEKKYISYNIENTRDAYGINVEEIGINDDGTITNQEMLENEVVVKNINANNEQQVIAMLNNNLTNKGQYKFSSTSIGLYNIEGKDSLVYITPREIVSTDNSYTNSTYENTHGYGVIVTSSSETDKNGDFVNYQKDFSEDKNVINVSNPRIYFGLETNKTIVTNSNKQNEFDYPKSESSEDASNSYDGKAGMKLNSLDKMILALSKGDFNLAFSRNLNSNSKILTNRNVIERAKKIMPYLIYDESPYLIVTESGKLVWVIDAYTTTKYYPYSQKTNLKGQEVNYVKNSVKVLVDAYDGDIKFYITDRTDLIVMAYQKAFPDVFMKIDEHIPDEINRCFKYPKYLYNVQTEILKRYHNTETDVIYRANDMWDIAKYGSGISSTTEQQVQVEPYYTMVKTSEESQSRLGLILPYTMYGKQSLSAYVVGSYDNGVPNLKIYRYNTDNSIIGPIQLDTQINQNEEISKQISNLDVSGTKITKGIVAVPLNNKMIYVESIYQEYLNENNSLPKLKKVIVASGSKIAIGDDIENALYNLLSQGYDIELGNYENKEELIKSIIKANKNLKESTANSDYEMIGKDIDRLQNLINQLEKLEDEELKDKSKNENINQNMQVDKAV